MPIVIRRNNGDVLWFDAVTEYGATYSSTATKHPIATGGFVSDHVIKDNVVIQLNAVLSDADFNLSRATGADNIYRPKEFTNYTVTAVPVQITEGSSINKLLPEVIAKFTKDTIPEVIVTPQSKAKSAHKVKLDLIEMWNNSEEFQILDVVENSIREQFSPCVLTNLSFREDASTGMGVFPNMTIEQLKFTDVKEVQVIVKTANKGRKSGDVTTPDLGADPAKEPAKQTELAAEAARKSAAASASTTLSTP